MMRNNLAFCMLLVLLSVQMLKPLSAAALEPREIMVLANGNVAQSIELARYYMNRRGISKENMLVVRTSAEESLAWERYEKEVATPVKEFLRLQKNRDIRCIVTLYGMPIKISSSKRTGEEEESFVSLRSEEKTLEEMLANATEKDKKAFESQLKKVKARIKRFKLFTDRAASLDSELSLVKTVGYRRGFWLPNPFFADFQNKPTAIDKTEVILTARLDGPDDRIVRRIIDDTILAETEGLQGVAYFDARWQADKEAGASSYVRYDQSIHRAFERLKKQGEVDAQIEATEELYQQGDCPDSALYCGWYSLANYIDAFDWQPGSVGYHIASAECQTLKRPGSNVWCKKMLEDGIAATIGPVGEPYIQAFPPPDLFFGKLLEERLCLVEAYFQSLPFLSWKMVLIGDPLYRLNLRGRLSETDVAPHP